MSPGAPGPRGPGGEGGAKRRRKKGNAQWLAAIEENELCPLAHPYLPGYGGAAGGQDIVATVGSGNLRLCDSTVLTVDR